MAVDLGQIIPPLVRAKVDFILIGGMAAILHGSARVTFDVDLFIRAHIKTLSASLLRWRCMAQISAMLR